jgi:anti-sigma regulatory factor (Ser/Thr protein kinase)
MTMSQHFNYPMDEPSRVGEARRMAVQMASSLDFDSNESGRLALVVTELGSNLIKHAIGGRMLIACRQFDDATSIEIISMDAGPGITNLENSLRNGFSTTGTLGNGLGAVRRLADDFEIHTQISEGTLVLARIYRRGKNNPPDNRRSHFSVGAVCLAAPDETVVGDDWDIAIDGARAVVMVADGLGHGPLAAEAAVAALDVFRLAPFCGPAQLIEKTHAALSHKRGAAITIVDANDAEGKICFAGAGNVMGRLVSGVVDKTLMSQHGTVGVQIRRPQTQQIEWPAHALLILHSDGVTTRWDLRSNPDILRQDPSIIAALLIRDHCRGRDDATVVVLRRERH